MRNIDVSDFMSYLKSSNSGENAGEYKDLPIGLLENFCALHVYPLSIQDDGNITLKVGNHTESYFLTNNDDPDSICNALRNVFIQLTNYHIADHNYVMSDGGMPIFKNGALEFNRTIRDTKDQLIEHIIVLYGIIKKVYKDYEDACSVTQDLTKKLNGRTDILNKISDSNKNLIEESKDYENKIYAYEKQIAALKEKVAELEAANKNEASKRVIAETTLQDTNVENRNHRIYAKATVASGLSKEFGDRLKKERDVANEKCNMFKASYDKLSAEFKKLEEAYHSSQEIIKKYEAYEKTANDIINNQEQQIQIYKGMLDNKKDANQLFKDMFEGLFCPQDKKEEPTKGNSLDMAMADLANIFKAEEKSQTKSVKSDLSHIKSVNLDNVDNRVMDETSKAEPSSLELKLAIVQIKEPTEGYDVAYINPSNGIAYDIYNHKSIIYTGRPFYLSGALLHLFKSLAFDQEA